MPAKVVPLAPYQLKRLKAPGFYAVGEVVGLFLRIRKPSCPDAVLPRCWILRVTIGEGRCDVGLGSYPEVSLEQARVRAKGARELAAKGIHPNEAIREARRAAEEVRRAAEDAKRAAEAAAAAAAAKRLLFKDAAKAVHEKKCKEFDNPKHAQQWWNTLETYAFPIIGHMDVLEVERAHVFKILTPIWETKNETASRVRGRIESVIAYAHVALNVKGRDNPATWTNGLDQLLIAPTKAKTVEHFAALPWRRAPEFMAELDKEPSGMAATCLRFAIITHARSGEARGATWDEMDFEAKEWKIAPERMKGRKYGHRVPLSHESLALLRSLPRMHGCNLVFPSVRGTEKTPTILSENTLSKVVDRITARMPGSPEATPHGFRSVFKDWARNQRHHEDEVSELALAHVNDDKTRAAYARDELMGKRRALMRKWMQYLFGRPAANAAEFRRAA